MSLHIGNAISKLKLGIQLLYQANSTASSLIKVGNAISKLTLDNNEQKQCYASKEKDVDYSQRAQWLQAVVLGSNDGLVSAASLMMGTGLLRRASKPYNP